MVPAIIIKSAWRGVARATAHPNRLQSYFAPAVLIISMAQQLVPKTNGQRELERAQFTTSSSWLIKMPPPAVSILWPGNGSGFSFFLPNPNIYLPNYQLSITNYHFF